MNGEAIYGTRPFEILWRGSHGSAGGRLHRRQEQAFYRAGYPLHNEGQHALRDCAGLAGYGAHREVLGANGPLKGRKIRSITMLGSEAKLKWKQTGDALTVISPARESGEFAFVYKIELD